jgi:YgiT-type zinc finger domain-containing protein
MRKPKPQPCAVCGRLGLLTKLVTRSFGRGASLLVIEGIPLHSCPHCGEAYLTADTLHEIERIRALRKARARVRRRVSPADVRGTLNFCATDSTMPP